MRVIKDFILREIAGEYILIPVGETAMDIHGMIGLTESGKLLWQKLQQDCTVTDLIDCILNEYDIDQETAEKDVQAFLDKMNRIGILESGD